MNEPDNAAIRVPEPSHAPRSREACLELLAAVIAHAPGGVRGTAVFLLDCGCLASSEDGARGWRIDDLVIAEAARRISAASPAWHRLLRIESGEFLVIAQGLVDGGAVLGAAARLVHALDDVLQIADRALCPEVSIGIAFAPQHGGRAEALLAAAESGLRESMATVRNGARGRSSSGAPPLGSFS